MSMVSHGEPWWDDTDRGKPENSRRTCPSTTLNTTNPTWTEPGANPVLRGRRPATRLPSHGAAFEMHTQLLVRNSNRKYHSGVRRIVRWLQRVSLLQCEGVHWFGIESTGQLRNVLTTCDYQSLKSGICSMTYLYCEQLQKHNVLRIIWILFKKSVTISIVEKYFENHSVMTA
jgi:hypothetical protein